MPGSTSNTRSYSFVYTPNGHWSNLCVADPGTNKLVLRTCNGLQWQRFIAERTSHGNTPTAIAGFQGDRIRDNDNSNPFSLRDVATNLYVQDTSHASAFGPAAVPDTRQLVTGGVSTYTDNQLWTWQS
jgi:hypothetical protein